MHRTRVGVLRGGANDYETSLKTGGMVVRHLPDHYYTEDIFIDKKGTWFQDGLEVSPHAALSHLDVVWNALHGPYADGGHVQHLLEQHKIPFTGSGAFVSSVARNSMHFKELLRRGNIRAIPYRLVQIPTDGEGEALEDLFKTFAPPVIVRPVAPGAAVSMARTYPGFIDMLAQGFQNADEIILEEFIPGTSASVGVINSYRDQDLYALPVISGDVLSHEEKKGSRRNCTKSPRSSRHAGLFAH
jgi:D-alanine-D-alanine ligase